MANKTSGGSIVPNQLRCEYSINPIGVGEAKPRLSWKLSVAPAKKPATDLTQSAYQIGVASSAAKLGEPDLWDSGKVKSSESVFIAYGGKPLVSAQRVWWTVRVWDQDGKESPAAKPAFWEMGLLERGQWKAQWIGWHIVGGPNTEVPSPLLRKTFSVDSRKKIAAARLYVTALGFYEFRLNGQRVGDDVFTPGHTNYRKRVQYQVYDVTGMVQPGENAVAAILADGWYCGYVGNTLRRQFYGDRPKLLAQLAITFTDGSVQQVVSDEMWNVAQSPIISSDMLMGESYDARQEIAGWDKAEFKEDERWLPVTLFDDPGMALSAMVGPTVRAVKELHPIAPPKRSGGGWLLDFGQNMVGRVRIKVKGNAGHTVTLKFVEILDKDGRAYFANLRGAKQTDNYTLRGDANGEVFEPRFTFHGFRYLEVSHWPGEPKAEDFVGVVLHSDMEQTGSFECSEPLLNQLQHNIEWGQRGNFVDIPTDCPQRDERLGWTGDAQVFVRTAAFNFDVSGFFAKWTQDLRDAQGQRGSYPKIVPNMEVVRDDGKAEWEADGGPAWADAGIICPWTMYQCFGDARLVARHFDSMCKFVDHMKAEADPFELIRSHPQWHGWHGFGDWLSTDGPNVFGGTPKELIGTAFLAYDATLLASIAAALRRDKEAGKYAKIAKQATAAFNRRYVTADGLVVGNTQTAYVLALHFGLLPEELRPAAAEALVQLIKNNGNKLTTGFVGSPYLNHVLTAAGKLDVAYQLLLQKNWPSWLYAVTQGATTIWERWDGWTHEKGFQDAGMNSFNHYAYGAIGAWLYQVVTGIEIDPLHPGYQHVILRPHAQANGPLTFAKAAIETIRGKIESGWKLEKDGKTLKYDVTLPPNVTAAVYLPGAVKGQKIGSGTHQFTAKLA